MFLFDKIKNAICTSPICDKVKMVMMVTMVWAKAGFYTAKAFEYFFSSILLLPDQWFNFVNYSSADLSTTDNKKIIIKDAKTSDECITNKLKLFLIKYWEKTDDSSALNNNGFDFKMFSKLFNDKLLFCSYILVGDEDTINNLHHILITKEGKTTHVSKMDDLADKKRVFANHVSFDGMIDSSDLDKDLAALMADCNSL